MKKQNKFKALFFYKEDVYNNLKKLLVKRGFLSKSTNFFLNSSHAVLKRLHVDHKIKKNQKNNQSICAYDGYLYGNDIKRDLTLSELRTLINTHKNTYDFEIDATIVIPIYNGLEHLKALFPSLLKNTDRNVKIILVDDCSPDKEVVPFIKAFVDEYKNAELVQNENNLGFTATMNKGMSLVKTKYAIWLNTDTVLPNNWVKKLLKPFYQFENIATTTPFTNAGVFFSYPTFGENNTLNSSLDELNEYFDHVVDYNVNRNTIHSGVGFCMGVNMEVWNKVGPLNVEIFGKGYGEENDWCFRALNLKYRHVIVPNLFVEHRHGGSFNSAEKQKLCDEHQQILMNTYPHIMGEVVPAMWNLDKWKAYRQIAILFESNKNLSLVIDLDSENNGANDFVKNELKSDKNRNYIFARYTSSNQWRLCFNDLIDPKQTNSIPLFDFCELKNLFEILDIKNVVVNNLAFNYSPEPIVDTLLNLKNIFGFKITYLFHDYLSACPALFLTAKNGVPCKYENSEKCNECLKNNNYRALQRIDIDNWRKVFKKLLLASDRLIFFSKFSSMKICEIYPEIAGKFEIIEHKQIMNDDYTKYESPKDNKIVKIAFVGSFCRIKGSAFYSNLVARFRKEKLRAEFIVVGQSDAESFDKKLGYTGRYKREELGQILTENKVNLVIYPSINNETYSYAVQELMTLGIPLVVFAAGAPKERLIRENYKYFEIAEDVTDESLYNATIKLTKTLGFDVNKK